MIELWRRVVIGSGIAIYLVGGAALGGVVVHRLRVDPVQGHGEAVRAGQEVVIDAEGQSAAPAFVSSTEVQR